MKVTDCVGAFWVELKNRIRNARRHPQVAPKPDPKTFSQAPSRSPLQTTAVRPTTGFPFKFLLLPSPSTGAAQRNSKASYKYANPSTHSSIDAP